MDQERLTVFKAELQAQLSEIDAIYGKIEARSRQQGEAAIESLGYQLHNLYCAFEDLFKIVAAEFENHIEDKSRYHSELLKRMTMTIEGVRPPFISHAMYVLLDTVRAFRHVFRHAYSYELDQRKITIVQEDALKLRVIFRKEVDAFLRNFAKD